MLTKEPNRELVRFVAKLQQYFLCHLSKQSDIDGSFVCLSQFNASLLQ